MTYVLEYGNRGGMHCQFDDKDREIARRRAATFARWNTPQVGDFVRFADGVVRRISYVWPDGVQTSCGGSWHLFADGVSSFSGGLCPPVHPNTLTLTQDKRDGVFWFFHHDLAGAHRGVDCSIPCRVWECSQNAT
jgi:hypothetical protein